MFHECVSNLLNCKLQTKEISEKWKGFILTFWKWKVLIFSFEVTSIYKFPLFLRIFEFVWNQKKTFYFTSNKMFYSTQSIFEALGYGGHYPSIHWKFHLIHSVWQEIIFFFLFFFPLRDTGKHKCLLFSILCSVGISHIRHPVFCEVVLNIGKVFWEV